jgi:hypothetical protein
MSLAGPVEDEQRAQLAAQAAAAGAQAGDRGSARPGRSRFTAIHQAIITPKYPPTPHWTC